MAKVELKQPIVQAIAEEIKDAQSVVLVDYRGLTVAEDTELRKQLREAGIVYKVYKNTMMKRAFEGTECEALESCLEGPSAIAISKDDATAPARILCKFAKDAPALERQTLPRSHQEKNFSPSRLEACSPRSATLLGLSSRSQSRAARQTQRKLRRRKRQLRQRRLRQRKRQLRQQKLRLRQQRSKNQGNTECRKEKQPAA